MGAIGMRVQRADKNITIIHSNPHFSPSVNVLWSQKQLEKSCFLQWKRFSSESGKKYAQTKLYLQGKEF